MFCLITSQRGFAYFQTECWRILLGLVLVRFLHTIARLVVHFGSVMYSDWE